MRKRINITLPEETLELIDRVTEHGDRSRFIEEAVRHYIQETGRANLRKRLEEGAMQRGERDLQLVEEWFSVGTAGVPSWCIHLGDDAAGGPGNPY
jgi:CopG family transcriptional regulator / antitoxin EndoAI